MDKASIVGDAVMYVQQLQKQAKKLRGEIAGLESSLKGGPEQFHGSSDRTLIVGSKKQSIFKKIVQVTLPLFSQISKVSLPTHPISNPTIDQF